MRTILGLTQSAFDPASRVRFIQFIPYLKESGWNVVHCPNRPDRQWFSPLRNRVARGLHYRAGRVLMKWNRWRDLETARSADVVFVNRDLAGSGTFFEQRLLKKNPRVVFDFDDAIFVGRNAASVRWMCERAAWITPGNEYLAKYARNFNSSVTVIPTVIDTDRYLVREYGQDECSPVRIGWSGSDLSIRTTLFPFLEMMSSLQKTIPFELVIISNTRPELPVTDLRWSFQSWQPESESLLSTAMDIGIMPLVDNEFQRGKCGLKLLQYMAAGLPTVASPVGVNADITLPGETGYLATTPKEWEEALAALVRQPDLRAQLGRAGRTRCEQHYSIRSWLPRLVTLFERVMDACPR
jgi:glycosyltransferase involved in cell wall biosynthesis